MPRQPELLEVGADGLGGVPGFAQRRDVAPSARFESFFPSSPTTRPWWITCGRLVPERAVQRGVQRLVRPVIRAADHVRDLEVHVVDDARQVERRRAVVAPEHHSLEALRQSGLPGGGEVALSPRALADGAVVPRHTEPAQVVEHALLPARDIPPGIGVVDPQQQPVAEIPVGNGAERVPDVQRAGRAGCEADPIHAADRSATLDSGL